MADQLREEAQQALAFVASDNWVKCPCMDVGVYIDAARLRDALRAALAQQAEPVQKKPLTEDEIHSIAAQVARQDGKWIFLFTRAVEEAHGIKEAK